MRLSCCASARICSGELAAALGQPGVPQQHLRVQIHRTDGVLEVVDDERHEPLLLELKAQKLVPLPLEDVVVLANFGP